jgi:hypothetical protein
MQGGWRNQRGGDNHREGEEQNAGYHYLDACSMLRTATRCCFPFASRIIAHHVTAAIEPPQVV